MPILRMTTRRWMIAVAVVGITAGLAARSASFARRAEFYKDRFWSEITHQRPPETPEEVAEARRTDRLHDLWMKYEDAARRPWLPVPPDPPEPPELR